MHEDVSDREHLSDGVYVGYDGRHIVLWQESPGGPYGQNAIALHPLVWAKVSEYWTRIVKREVRRRMRPWAQAQEAEGGEG